MKLRITSSLLLFLVPLGQTIAQQNADRWQAELMAWARLKTMTPSDFQTLKANAQGGDAEAQCWVSTAYETGQLVPKNDEESAHWMLKSAEQGYAPAERLYGMMSARENPAVGERWLVRAAELGDAEAQFWLGVAYEQNWFGTTDVKLAVKWYEQAAETGHPDAQVELGEKYENGEGVDQNFELASKWYRKAAEHVPDLGGAGQGRNRLGLLYMEGLGVPQDYSQAYFWFSLGGSQHNIADAKSHLSFAQIREIDALVEQWKEQHRVDPELAAALHLNT